MSRKRALGWLVAGAVSLSGVLMAGPAQAVEPEVVRVPGHPVASALRLIGASQTGVAVVQGDDENLLGSRSQAPVLTGAEGDELVERPEVQPERSYGERILLDVRADQLGWATSSDQYSERSLWQVHRTNILTGEDVTDGSTPRPAVFEGGSWLTKDSLLRWPPADVTLPLYRHRVGSGAGGRDGEMDVTKLLEHGEGIIDIANDANGAIVMAVADPPLPGQYEEDPDAASRVYRVQRYGPWGTEPETIFETSDEITSVAAAPWVAAWDTRASGQDRKIHYEGVIDGEQESSVYTETTAMPSIDLAVGWAGVGYLVPQEGSAPVLRVVRGGTARTVNLPEGSAGLAAVGDRFLTAAGGSSDVAGVYSVSPDDRAVRTATVPSSSQPVQDVELAGSSLYYTDSTPDGDGVHSIWQAVVTKSGSLGVGESQRLKVKALSDTASSPSWYETHFSAGRGLVLGLGENPRWALLDRGKVTGTIEVNGQYGFDDRPTVSGPYALVDRNVVRPDGEEVYQVPEPLWYGLGDRELFGSTIVYSTYPSYPETEQGSEIWVDDVEDPEPQLLGNSSGCFPGAPVAVWGETVAWTSSCSTGAITVKNLRTGAERTVEGGAMSPYGLAGDLELGEGALFWTRWSDAKGIFEGRVLDLRTPGAQPVALQGDWTESAFDDHLLARRVGQAGPIEVMRLPFDADYRPRLIGKVAGSQFSPSAGGTWHPRFDTTKPLVEVKLTFTDSVGRVLRTLTGTAPDGSIRDLVWDGRDRQGRLQAPGLYRWTLTASAADGDGLLMGKKGGTSVTGSVRVKS